MVAPFAGEARVGAAGGVATTVLKLQAVGQALVPPAFVAFTRQ